MGKIIRRILTIIPAVALQSLWLLLLMKWLTPYAPIIAAIKDDFIATQAKCKEVKPYDMKHYSRRWVVDGVLRIFAPLC